ncbi:sulfate adenylyltransferase subunit 1 [Demequina sp. NBRC 110051]|uniref:sulfate adenylyltransferase subunit 1 n=1 Tax=Demequina sp. NBRC 110051 TaxID=1570340 RepID=UPI000A01304E|nr:GTP-binding protein [Demequina sp. NBRC 110051]
MDLLRFATAGSVDDGKSTLIGRLLYDSKSIFEDQLESIELASKNRGAETTDLALLTDGLRAEREQGITIDVAYRYFATPKRKFIIADTPGHQQYTRNMVTGASTADLAIILVDARKGLTEQSRRHATISSLLRVPHVVLAVNKMDLVDWSEERFDEIYREFTEFASKLDIPDLTAIPVSALLGDNIVDRSANMDWYGGTSLLYHLENVHIGSDRNLQDVRFPIQFVVRPQTAEHPDYRGFAGQVASGILKVGDEVMALPSGLSTRVAAIDGPNGPVDAAYPPMSVTVRLEDEIDLSRGDILCRKGNHPEPTQDVEATVCWMDASALKVRDKVSILHTSRMARAMVKDIAYELNVNTLHRDQEATELGLNSIGRVSLRVTSPLLVDDYAENRITGSFILIDEATNRTVGAGVIRN